MIDVEIPQEVAIQIPHVICSTTSYFGGDDTVSLTAVATEIERALPSSRGSLKLKLEADVAESLGQAAFRWAKHRCGEGSEEQMRWNQWASSVVLQARSPARTNAFR